MANQLNVVVKLQIEGFHFWKDAPKEVEFLRDNHRHIFHIECIKAVTHGDRDVEIILFKREVSNYLMRQYGKFGIIQTLDFGPMSCEMIAEELIEAFDLISCKVLEDNENGAYVIAE